MDILNSEQQIQHHKGDKVTSKVTGPYIHISYAIITRLLNIYVTVHYLGSQNVSLSLEQKEMVI